MVRIRATRCAAIVVVALAACLRSLALPPNTRPLFLQPDDRILVLAPHPDDEVLGCGGILQKAVGLGLPVRVVFMTYGDSNEWSFLAYRKRLTLMPGAALNMGTLRRLEAIHADRVLGVPEKDLVFLGYPDYGTLRIWISRWGASRPPGRGNLTRATKVPYATAFRPGAPYRGEEILHDLETVLREFRPTKVFVSHPADRHPDHAALYLFTRVALWDTSPKIHPEVYPYLVHYSRWPAKRPTDEIDPPINLADDMTWESSPVGPAQRKVKRKALAAHRTQFKYSARRLVRFVRDNELFGEPPAILLTPKGGPGAIRGHDGVPESKAVEPDDIPKGAEKLPTHLAEVSRLRMIDTGPALKFSVDLDEPLRDQMLLSLLVMGYRSDRPFATMPKLEIRFDRATMKAFNDGRPLPRNEIGVVRTDGTINVTIPLDVMGNPQKFFVGTWTLADSMELSRVPWQVVDLRPAAKAGTQEADRRSVGTSGPRDLGTSGPRVLGSSGPRDLGSSGPRVLGTSGPRDLGTSGPRVLGSSGPRVLGSSGPRVLGINGNQSSCHALGNGAWCAAPSRPRMRFTVDLDQLRVVQVGVLLRRRKRDVPQQFLDRAKVRAGVEQMCREGMTKRVGRGAAADRSAAKILVEESPDASGRDPAASVVDEERMLVVIDFADQHRSIREPGPDRFFGLPSERHDPFLRALAAYLDESRAELDVVEIDRYELADAEARSVDQLEPCPVAPPEGGPEVRLVEQNRDVVGLQHRGKALFALRCRDAPRRVATHHAFSL